MERFHKKDFRIDKALGHILRIYKDIMKVLKNKEDKDAYKKYLQKL